MGSSNSSYSIVKPRSANCRAQGPPRHHHHQGSYLRRVASKIFYGIATDTIACDCRGNNTFGITTVLLSVGTAGASRVAVTAKWDCRSFFRDRTTAPYFEISKGEYLLELLQHHQSFGIAGTSYLVSLNIITLRDCQNIVSGSLSELDYRLGLVEHRF